MASKGELAVAGTLHQYFAGLVAFQYPNSGDFRNVLIWIGGLGDGLLSVDYVTVLARNLPEGWDLVHPLLTSSYTGWGTGSLKRDAEELGECVKYFEQGPSGRRKIVLMGSSTGSQDVMEYMVGEGAANRTPIDGAILQAGISDREAMKEQLPDDVYKKSIDVAQQYLAEGKGDDILPQAVTQGFFGAPISARRWLSLGIYGGDDDYFSSDLETYYLKERFGKVPKHTSFMFLFGGADEHVPEYVDKLALVDRWTKLLQDSGVAVDDLGGVIPGAHHTLQGDPEEVVMDLVNRVKGFLGKL